LGPERDAAGSSKSEEADEYAGIIVKLNCNWRVIVCAAGIQWVLQRRAGERHGTARWEGRGFCRTREALNRLSRKRGGVIDPAAIDILDSLPERIHDVVRVAPATTGRTISAPTTATTINIDTS
jgi:hypothetical protein